MYEIVCLNDAVSIVMTSFKSHRSISYLDLQLSALTTAKWMESTFGYFPDLPSFYQKSFFCSEENLLNSLVPDRSLLYCLNLDLPRKNEFVCFREMNVEIFIHQSFYSSVFGHLMETAFDIMEDKFRLFNWIANLNEIEPLVLRHGIEPLDLRHDITVYFLNQLYPHSKDSNFVTKCFLKFMSYCKLVEMDDPKMLEYFLYHACKSDYPIKTMYWGRNLANECIFSQTFRCFPSILKYEDRDYCQKLFYDIYENYVQQKRRLYTEIIVDSKLSRERHYRMLQIIFFFDRRNVDPTTTLRPTDPEDLSKVLWLIWNSIPDAFITLQEMQCCLGITINSNEIIDIHNYYEEAIRRTVPCLKPRTLLHYCKTFIRQTLYNNDHWLPEGIKKLGLPKELENYLNLEF